VKELKILKVIIELDVLKVLKLIKGNDFILEVRLILNNSLLALKECIRAMDSNKQGGGNKITFIS